MKRYAILRTTKLKRGEVIKSARHAFREIDTPNADPALLKKNAAYGPKTAQGVEDAVRKRIDSLERKTKLRKDAVHVVEFVVTFSPGALDDKQANAYLKDSLRWIRSNFGKDNLVAAVIHRDEKTPHLSAYITPIFDGRLNARERFGGADKLVKLQDDFANQVGAKYGLERGVKKSRAKHTKVREFYGLLDKELAELPKPQLGMVVTRATAQQHIDEAHAMAQAAVAQNLALRLENERLLQNLTRINELEREKEALAEELAKIQVVFAKAGINQKNLFSWLTYAQGIVAKHEAEVDVKWAELLREDDELMQEDVEQQDGQAHPDQRDSWKGPKQ